jgi:hypothetical protein
MIARAFVLAYRIMAKIIETKGDTDWLKNGAPHCNVPLGEIIMIQIRGVKPMSLLVDVVNMHTLLPKQRI